LRVQCQGLRVQCQGLRVQGLDLWVVEWHRVCSPRFQETRVEIHNLWVVEKHRERVAVYSCNDANAALCHGPDGLHLGEARNLIHNNCVQGLEIRILGERLETSSTVTCCRIWFKIELVKWFERALGFRV